MNEQDPNSSPEKMFIPTNDLEYNMITTNNVWGSDEVGEELKGTFREYSVFKNAEGKDAVSYQDLWSLLKIFTRDLRLSNLSSWDNELQTTRYDLKLASDLLQEGFRKPSLVCLSNTIGILETAQSKGGFLRRRMNTFTKETSHQELEPPKKSFFFGKGSGNNNNGGQNYG
jgi:hypothetical protein